MGENSKHAIVYGASGLIGWALVDQLLSPYPQSGTFSKVTAVTNRPLDLERSCWPKSDSSRPGLQLVSGINLQDGDGGSLAGSLKESVEHVDTVTHIFYLGEFVNSHKFPFSCDLLCIVFTAIDDDIEEVATNLRMLQNVIDAHTTLSTDLQFVAFPGGTRVSTCIAPELVQTNERVGIRHLRPWRHIHSSTDRGHGGQSPCGLRQDSRISSIPQVSQRSERR